MAYNSGSFWAEGDEEDPARFSRSTTLSVSLNAGAPAFQPAAGMREQQQPSNFSAAASSSSYSQGGGVQYFSSYQSSPGFAPTVSRPPHPRPPHLTHPHSSLPPHQPGMSQPAGSAMRSPFEVGAARPTSTGPMAVGASGSPQGEPGQGVMVAYQGAGQMAPPPRPTKSSNKPDGKPFSVKYLTCWYWANSQCKKPEWECAYSHRYTGVMSEMPVQKAPGQPLVAGANASKAQPTFTDWRTVRNDPPPPRGPGPYQLSSNEPHGQQMIMGTHMGESAGPPGAPAPYEGNPSVNQAHLSSQRSRPTPTQVAIVGSNPASISFEDYSALKNTFKFASDLASQFEDSMTKHVKEDDIDIVSIETLLAQVKANDATPDQVAHLLERIHTRKVQRREWAWDAINKYNNERKTMKRVAKEEGVDLDFEKFGSTTKFI